MKQHRDRYDNQDDATLVASILAGEREAFDILLSRYSSSVLRLCTTLLGNTFEAQDIAQEAALQACEPPSEASAAFRTPVWRTDETLLAWLNSL